MSVFIKTNKDWTECLPNPKLIFIIVPGAGTYTNRKEYSLLQQNYDLVHFGSSGGKYDKYPSNWTNNKKVKDMGEHLGGIAGVIKSYILENNKIPSAIICGSRGGQVTIGKVWYSIWRGPSIIVNAGCLTSNTIIPSGVKPLFITMGKDYFTTVNTIEKTIRLYYKLVKVRNQFAHFIHIPDQPHMPIFDGELQGVLLNSVLYLTDIIDKINNKTIISKRVN